MAINNLKFDHNKHAYEYLGDKVPSVTQILGILPKPGLDQWKLNLVLEHIRQVRQAGMVDIDQLMRQAKGVYYSAGSEAARLGTEVHEAAEAYLKHGYRRAFSNEEVNNAFNAFMAWCQDTRPEVIATERMIFHPEEWYAGTVDLVAKIGDRKFIVDYKTSGRIYSSYLLQLAAYQQAYQEETGELIDGVCVLRLPKNGFPYETRVVAGKGELVDLFEVFVGVKNLYNWLKQNKWR